MGLMKKIFGADKSATEGITAANGAHAIDKTKVLRSTDGNVPTPTNPGNFDSIRSAPVVESPRYFTREEANALSQVAKQKKSESSAAKRAYKHLKRIDTADATVHQVHYNYLRKVAGNEFKKVKSSQTYARRLHGLRPQYLELGQGLEAADKTATDAIAKIRGELENG